MKVVVVLNNIRSAGNVGSILRTSEGFGVEAVIFSGYTPRPDDERILPHLREKLNKQIEKTALGAEKLVKNYSSHDIISELREFKKKGYVVAGLENNIEDKRLISLCNSNFPTLKKRLGERVVLVLGEEVEGINYSFYDIIDVFLEIPMFGEKESFNVSVAAGIALFGLSCLY
ncbi:TrmH family RNA methyltransferase [Candidatus Saccharibacteria bacterium]|nr:TrmH family RNA methyltransferase [Candidatus Saccharibacteria bacterium]